MADLAVSGGDLAQVAPKQLSRAERFIQTINIGEATKQEFDLDNWIYDFEQGFPRFEKNNPVFRQGNWGQPYSDRPHIRELNVEGDAQSIEGYRLIEFFPNRSNKDESYMLFGSPSELRTQVSLMMNTWLMMQSRDIGTFVGYPDEEFLRLKPTVGIKLRIFLTTYKQPPYWQMGSKWFSRRQVTIPLANPQKINFAAIREACGGDSGQVWGEWQTRAYVGSGDFKGLSQMVCGGNTKEKSKENLEKFLAFTQLEVRGMSSTQIDYTKGERAQDADRSKYNRFEVYPAWISLGYSKLVAMDDARKDGKKTLSGKMLSNKNKIWIHMQKEPSWWTTRVNEVLGNKSFS